ncbi:universal stress protein [Phenylobacterium aquaticum]|uniref:universal stress protein n=1 Tax=Phenylobacterium aquaticum TaxID=1763816 RepID=UPI0026EFA99D|nr:universal stress protein [Phenylobacterium aquaticum]
MTYASLLVHVQPGVDEAPRLETAAALARDLGAQLFGLSAEAPPALGVSDPTGMLQAEWMGVMQQELDRRLTAAQALFAKAAEDLPGAWRGVLDLPTRAMAGAARGCDLIVTGGAPLDNVDLYSAVDNGELVIRAGRPVLVAPPSGGRLSGRRIVLAWKDTREARRALTDSLPLLKRAEEVVVYEICGADAAEGAAFRTEEVVAQLGRHGVTARAKVRANDDDRVCDELNIEAQAIDADLIVAGAYGHNRFNEWAMGGVTRALLRRPERFVLLSH